MNANRFHHAKLLPENKIHRTNLHLLLFPLRNNLTNNDENTPAWQIHDQRNARFDIVLQTECSQSVIVPSEHDVHLIVSMSSILASANF